MSKQHADDDVTPETIANRQMVGHAVLELSTHGVRDRLKGGVAPRTLARWLPLTQDTLRTYCEYLRDEGVLVEVQGVARKEASEAQGTHARRSFLPRGHEDAPAPDTGSGGPPMSIAQLD